MVDNGSYIGFAPGNEGKRNIGPPGASITSQIANWQ